VTTALILNDCKRQDASLQPTISSIKNKMPPFKKKGLSISLSTQLPSTQSKYKLHTASWKKTISLSGITVASLLSVKATTKILYKRQY